MRKDNLSCFIEWINIPSNQLFFLVMLIGVPFTLGTIIWFVNNKKK